MVNKVVILMNMLVRITLANGRTSTPVTINKTQINHPLVMVEVCMYNCFTIYLYIGLA